MGISEFPELLLEPSLKTDAWQPPVPKTEMQKPQFVVMRWAFALSRRTRQSCGYLLSNELDVKSICWLWTWPAVCNNCIHTQSEDVCQVSLSALIGSVWPFTEWQTPRTKLCKTSVCSQKGCWSILSPTVLLNPTPRCAQLWNCHNCT